MSTDRRKNNYNIFFTSIFILLFILLLAHNLTLISVEDKINNLETKIDQYFAPIENVELPEWEDE